MRISSYYNSIPKLPKTILKSWNESEKENNEPIVLFLINTGVLRMLLVWNAIENQITLEALSVFRN